MVRKTGFILSAVFLVMFIFIGCSTIPMDEGKRHEGEIIVDYHFSAQGTTTDGLGIKLHWDILTTAKRYRVVFENSIDSVFPAFEVDQGDTTYFNDWSIADAQQLGKYTVYFSESSSGTDWKLIDSTRTNTVSGSSHLIAYGLNGSFAAVWDVKGYRIIGFEDPELHSLAEVYLYDPCDSMNRLDTTLFTIDTSFIVDTLNDTTWIYDSTVVIDTALAYLEIYSAYMPPFSGSKQAGVQNAGSDSNWVDMRIAPVGDQYLYSVPVVTGDVVWMQSVGERYMKILVDSIYLSPPASDRDSAVIYFHWRFQPTPKFRYVY